MSDTRTIIAKSKGTEEERKFEGAFNSVLHMDKRDYPNYVGGLMVASGHEYPISSPIDTSIIFGTFQEPEPGTADRAVDAAQKALKDWRLIGAEGRAKIIEEFVDRVKRQRYRFAAIVTLSSGMLAKDALEEVDTLISVAERETRAVLSGRSKQTGVWAILSEHASPLVGPVGTAVAAMLAGNTVVVLPSARVPLPVYAAYELLVQVGLPAGVFNMIMDPKGKMTDEITNNPEIFGIAAVGAGDRLEDLMFIASDDELLFVNEIKGMNPIFVYNPGDMKKAAETVIESAFSYAGQRLSATSKVVVTQAEKKKLIDALIPLVKNLVVGDPAEPETQCGPIVSAAAAKEFDKQCELLREYIVAGGGIMKGGMGEHGHYVRPALLDGLTDCHPAMEMDSAMPLLVIQTVMDFDEAIEAINMSEYGISAGIISKDAKAVERFKECMDAEVVFSNRPSSSVPAGQKAVTDLFVR